MPPLVLYGDKLCVKVTREFKQLVNISIAAGKFILIHPNYNLIREAMRLDVIQDCMLEDFEVHNWQYEVGEIISFDTKEIFFFYALLELSCRIFLCEIGDDLEKMAIENEETDEEEFKRVRGFYLRQAEDFLHEIKRSFNGNRQFYELDWKINQLNLTA
ncbi:MAG: hypothetical protein DWQ44_08445 [Bacteroidetes bacterium]|nr:MAG: hypothetical protein DWQ33_01845 [Bacteroidota bacterium]REK06994.1 MAG: hypothetical protein DWQ39_02245 [Bacteroidota bacterium]REK33659.1 MAG: hypothetical protein DWQ44_08445 [Bacteroidota bacterium]REK48645.1 MAG: hypothetical protein DWQ48_09885 [Bacteroidota bacterium]